MGSGLRAVAPRSLSRENAGRTMTVLHHALCEDDFDQTTVSRIFRETVQTLFRFCGRCNTGGEVLLQTIHGSGGYDDSMAAAAAVVTVAGAAAAVVTVSSGPRHSNQKYDRCSSLILL